MKLNLDETLWGNQYLPNKKVEKRGGKTEEREEAGCADFVIERVLKVAASICTGSGYKKEYAMSFFQNWTTRRWAMKANAGSILFGMEPSTAYR